MISYSIVICTRNQRNVLPRVLESLRTQIRNPKTYEIVIADDCSDDGTEAFVRNLRYPIFLKYSRAPRNEGRAHNRNRGTEKAAGGKVIFIDGDMVPGPDFVEVYLRAWEEYPEAVLAGSWRFPPDWKIGRWEKYLSTRGRLLMNRGERVEGRYFTSGNFAAAKRILDRMSGFDTSFEGWGGEDTDFGIRLDKESIPIYYIPEAACFHHDRKSLEEVTAQFESFGRDGFPQLARKHPGRIIYKNGWILGLPDPHAGIGKKAVSFLMSPLSSRLILNLLRGAARVSEGALFSDLCFDWLCYGHLAKGFRDSER